MFNIFIQSYYLQCSRLLLYLVISLFFKKQYYIFLLLFWFLSFLDIFRWLNLHFRITWLHNISVLIIFISNIFTGQRISNLFICCFCQFIFGWYYFLHFFTTDVIVDEANLIVVMIDVRIVIFVIFVMIDVRIIIVVMIGVHSIDVFFVVNLFILTLLNLLYFLEIQLLKCFHFLFFNILHNWFCYQLKVLGL